MKIPACMVRYLRDEKQIASPTPIQMQGLPAAFAGRDVIGIASTGSGKTLTFSLPLLLLAVEAETRLAYAACDGPQGVILCPSRELARQTHGGLVAMAAAMEQEGYAAIRVLLCTGGIPMAEQAHLLARGVHVVVATPGRLLDMLEHERLHLANCTYLCMDEADRMMDLGFEDDMERLLRFFPPRRQTLLFSATMPRKIREFAAQSLVRPVVISAGRAGAVSLHVQQCVELVAPDERMARLLDVLQKTAPPVIIFADLKHEVDDIYEFLLRKGVAAVAIHGSKTQDERDYAVRSFDEGRKDVMVASAVASKGLDFRRIEHVINYTMPRDIEDYVHQIGRTGRRGHAGVATTFVPPRMPDATLLDLKYLLLEARQPVPPFLADMYDPRADSGARTSCAVCGGLGHGVTQCPKLDDHVRRRTAGLGREEGGY